MPLKNWEPAVTCFLKNPHSVSVPLFGTQVWNYVLTGLQQFSYKMTAPTVKLSSGYEMPLVGFGLWKVNNDTCADQVYEAIKAGYRLFDGACGMSSLSSLTQSISTNNSKTRLRQ